MAPNLIPQDSTGRQLHLICPCASGKARAQPGKALRLGGANVTRAAYPSCKALSFGRSQGGIPARLLFMAAHQPQGQVGLSHPAGLQCLVPLRPVHQRLAGTCLQLPLQLTLQV